MVLVCLERLGRPRSNFVLVFYGATGVTSLKVCFSTYGATGVTSLKFCSSLLSSDRGDLAQFCSSIYGATGVTSLKFCSSLLWSDRGDLAQILFQSFMERPG